MWISSDLKINHTVIISQKSGVVKRNFIKKALRQQKRYCLTQYLDIGIYFLIKDVSSQ